MRSDITIISNQYYLEMPRKVKVSNIEEEKVEDVEAYVNVEPLEYGEVVKELKAEEQVEVDCPEDFITPPPGY